MLPTLEAKASTLAVAAAYLGGLNGLAWFELLTVVERVAPILPDFVILFFLLFWEAIKFAA